MVAIYFARRRPVRTRTLEAPVPDITDTAIFSCRNLPKKSNLHWIRLRQNLICHLEYNCICKQFLKSLTDIISFSRTELRSWISGFLLAVTQWNKVCILALKRRLYRYDVHLSFLLSISSSKRTENKLQHFLQHALFIKKIWKHHKKGLEHRILGWKVLM